MIKKIATLLLCLGVLQAAWAQQPAKVYETFDIQEMPEYPGGAKALQQYLADNVRYPALARENNIQGTAAVSFIIDSTGKIGQVTILRDPGAGCGKETVRVVNGMPRWRPGKVRGKPVSVKFTLPVRFRLEDDIPPANEIILESETDKKPVPPTGDQITWNKAVKKGVKLTKEEKKFLKKHKVISFSIDTTGKTYNLWTNGTMPTGMADKITKSMTAQGVWTPGQKGGKNVSVIMEMIW